MQSIKRVTVEPRPARNRYLLEIAELPDGQNQPDDQQRKDETAPKHQVVSHHFFLAIRAASLK